MVRFALVACLASVPAMAALVAESSVQIGAAWPQYVTMLTPLVLFLMGLAAKPMFENIVTRRIDIVEERFNKMEKDAHADILDAIEKYQLNSEHHNVDSFAHPNLAVFEKLISKIDILAADVSSIRAEAFAVEKRAVKRGKK